MEKEEDSWIVELPTSCSENSKISALCWGGLFSDAIDFESSLILIANPSTILL